MKTRARSILGVVSEFVQDGSDNAACVLGGEEGKLLIIKNTLADPGGGARQEA